MGGLGGEGGKNERKSDDFLYKMAEGKAYEGR